MEVVLNVQIEECRVWFGIGHESLLKHDCCKAFIEIHYMTRLVGDKSQYGYIGDQQKERPRITLSKVRPPSLPPSWGRNPLAPD